MKGEKIPAKIPRTMIDCGCRFNCHLVCPPQRQEILFQDFYKLKDTGRQKAYLSTLIINKEVQRQRPRSNDPKKIKFCSREYHVFNEDGERLRVCQKFFCFVFQKSQCFVDSAAKLKTNSGATVYVEHRNVGKSPSNKTSELARRHVISHIDSFPRVPGHYVRQQSKREYLSPDLNMAVMYRLYTEKYEDPVSYEVYRRIFTTHEPPLSMHTPKKDKCTLCMQFHDRNDPTIDDALSQKYHKHKEREQASLALKKATMNSPDVTKRTITFDLEAILMVPQASNSELFYKRKISIYNFTIYDSLSNGFCYMWDEMNGKKASSEIFTCLYRYISELPNTVTHLTTWSDTCSGQNRNKFLLAAMVFAVNSPNTHVNLIDIIYLESGHSYMECDSMHSKIEKAKKNKRIYIPSEMRMIVEQARMKPKPFNVNVLNFNEFWDFKTLFTETIKNSTLTSNGEKVEYLKIKWFRFQRDSEEVLFKYNYDDDFKSIPYSKDPQIINPPKRQRRKKNIPSASASASDNQNKPSAVPMINIPQSVRSKKLRLRQLYFNKFPISVAKKKDLVKLLKDGVIPPIYADYFNSLEAHKSVKDSFPYMLEEEEEIIFGFD